ISAAAAVAVWYGHALTIPVAHFPRRAARLRDWITVRTVRRRVDLTAIFLAAAHFRFAAKIAAAVAAAWQRVNAEFIARNRVAVLELHEIDIALVRARRLRAADLIANRRR